jgi:hypothetical protein
VLVSSDDKPQATFNIVVDGDQQIAANIYQRGFEADVIR